MSDRCRSQSCCYIASLAAILHHVSAINAPFVSHMLLQHRIYLSWFPANIWPHVNSFTPGRRGCDSKCVVPLTHFSDFILGISCEINPKWLTQILFDATSAVVNVILWGRLQTRYCLVQRWQNCHQVTIKRNVCTWLRCDLNTPLRTSLRVVFVPWSPCSQYNSVLEDTCPV